MRTPVENLDFVALPKKFDTNSLNLSQRGEEQTESTRLKGERVGC